MFSGQEMMMNNNNNNNKSTAFAQTCNRLSQFLKEKRSHGAFGSLPILDINGGKDENIMVGNRTMNFFPRKMEEEEEKEEKIKSLELFPLTSPSAATSSDYSDESNKKNVSDSNGGGKMTIFYNGQVIVFEDLPEDKAEEIMSLATQFVTPETPAPAQIPAPAPAMAQIPASVSDIPIARRVSLHRFIEKRKDRIAASSPYQVQRNANQGHVEKYDLMRQLRQQQQQQQQQRELKLF